jgi:hypothetical protein
MRYLEQQILDEMEAARRKDESGVIREMNENEALFLLIASRYGLTGKCCDELLKFTRKVSGDGAPGAHLRSFKSMRATTKRNASGQSGYLKHRCFVESAYTNTGLGHVDFEYLDILSVIVDILSDPAIVSSLDDITQKSEVVEEEGQRVFNGNINSGRWQERTEGILFGADGSAEITLGPIIIFIDGVALTKRGTQSAKPIMVTLACLKPEVRQKKVCVCALCVGGRGLYFFGTRIHLHIHVYMYIYMCTCT